jgi:hypothetical protein
MRDHVFEVYHTFQNRELAQEYADFLDKSNIEYVLGKVTPIFNQATVVFIAQKIAFIFL